MSSLSRVPLAPPAACLFAGVKGNKKGETVIVRHVLPAIGARTSYLNQRSSGIWGWALWAFCWVCFSLSQFPARRAFPCAGFSSRSSSTAGALLSWAPVALGLFRVEVVSASLNLSHSTIDVMRVYVPQFFVSSQQKFGVMDIKAPWRVTALGEQTVL